MTHHLSAYAVAETRSTEEMRGILLDVYDARACEFAGGMKQFSAEAAYFKFGDSSLSFCSYRGASRVQFRDDDYARFQFALTGGGRTSSARGSGDVGAGRVVYSPADAVLEFGETLDQFVLRVERTALSHDLDSLLGARPRQALSFDISAAADNEHTKRLRDLVIHTVDTIDLSAAGLPKPLLREMDQLLRLSVLYGMPNNLSHLIYEEHKISAPWQVKRIEDWIDAHWRDDVTIEKLAAVSGASARSIFATFKRARGCTPMAYLKTVRLRAAKQMLMNAEPNASVTAIAFACNFMNASHFAREYKNHFGEFPSETLRRGKARLR